MSRRGRRARWIAAAALAPGIAAALLLPQGAVAANAPRPAPPTALTAFALPKLHGRAFAPNALNYARPGRPGAPLLLFLPATGAVPADYRQFLDTASAVGFPVLALDYWNEGRSVVRTCAGDPDCYAEMQQNRFDGTRPSRYSAIDPQDSILTRLKTALAYLDRTQPRAGWGRYLAHDRVLWRRIVLGGHSQGGGQSAFIAHGHRVHGVLMFSSPVQSDGGVPAAWLRTPGVTPASDMYGLVSAHDLYYPNVVGSWAALGLGAPTVTDGTPPLGAHAVVSPRQLGTPREAHSLEITDRSPRGPTGEPFYRPIWTWMLRHVL